MKKAKTDRNQTEVVETFRECGCSVAITSNVHGGYPDLTVGVGGYSLLGDVDREIIEKFAGKHGLYVVNGVNLLIEVKDGDKPPSQRKLTPDQEVFFENWKGNVQVVRSESDARKTLGEKNDTT